MKKKKKSIEKSRVFVAVLFNISPTDKKIHGWWWWWRWRIRVAWAFLKVSLACKSIELSKSGGLAGLAFDLAAPGLI